MAYKTEDLFKTAIEQIKKHTIIVKKNGKPFIINNQKPN